MFAEACALVHDGGGHANRSCSSTRIARRFRTVGSFDLAATKPPRENPPSPTGGFENPFSVTVLLAPPAWYGHAGAPRGRQAPIRDRNPELSSELGLSRFEPTKVPP